MPIPRQRKAPNDAKELLVIDSKNCLFFLKNPNSEWSDFTSLVVPGHIKQDYN